jgi:hypothetical protein
VGRLRLTEPITSDASRSGFRRFQSATRSKSNLFWGSEIRGPEQHLSTALPDIRQLSEALPRANRTIMTTKRSLYRVRPATQQTSQSPKRDPIHSLLGRPPIRKTFSID